VRPKREEALPKTGPTIWVRRIKAGQTFRVTVISPAFWGFGTHYNGQCTVPCHEQRKDCEGHKRGWPYRPKFYLYVWVTETRRYEFLEFPPVAAHIFTDSIPPGRTFSGLSVVVKRGKGDKARLSLEFQPDYTGKMVEDKDPWPTLAALWSITTEAKERPDTVPLVVERAIQ
jgi:hypothetical protein